MSPDDRITVADIMEAGFCGSGARRWFHANGIDWHDVVKNGISVEDLMATGDALAQRVVDFKAKRNG